MNPQALVKLALLFFFISFSHTYAQVPVPPLTDRVTDRISTLTAQQKADLEQKLKAFEEKKGSQVAVLLVPTTRPETIEQYALRVAEQWKLGRENIDDGALLLIARDDRAVRIEVGYGLEGALTDATSKRIISEIIIPRLRAGDYYGGISAGVDSIINVVEGEPLPDPQRSRGAGPGGFTQWLPLVLLLVIVGGGILRTLLGRFPGALVTGVGAGIIAWILAGAFIVALIAAILAFIFTIFSGGMGHHGGWHTGGRGRGGFSGPLGGGFGGGSVFRGAGGTFGGGGASGRW